MDKLLPYNDTLVDAADLNHLQDGIIRAIKERIKDITAQYGVVKSSTTALAVTANSGNPMLLDVAIGQAIERNGELINVTTTPENETPPRPARTEIALPEGMTDEQEKYLCIRYAEIDDTVKYTRDNGTPHEVRRHWSYTFSFEDTLPDTGLSDRIPLAKVQYFSDHLVITDVRPFWLVRLGEKQIVGTNIADKTVDTINLKNNAVDRDIIKDGEVIDTKYGGTISVSGGRIGIGGQPAGDDITGSTKLFTCMNDEHIHLQFAICYSDLLLLDIHKKGDPNENYPTNALKIRSDGKTVKAIHVESTGSDAGVLVEHSGATTGQTSIALKSQNTSGGHAIMGVGGGAAGAVAIEGYSIADNSAGVIGRASGTGANGVMGIGNLGATYDFYAAGDAANYGPFTGAHDSLMKDPIDGIKPGMVVCFTGEVVKKINEDGSLSLSTTLPAIRITDTDKDKTVFGVFVKQMAFRTDHWYKPKKGEMLAIVNALGEGRVLVTNINGEIQAGDFITTSSVPGYAAKQDDDILHSYTLAKVTENIDWKSIKEYISKDGKKYKACLVAATYVSA
jgi:hypothetical protein